MDEIAQLYSDFGLPGQLRFKQGPGGMTIAEVDNGLAKATIALQGAHLLSWQPSGQQPVIWLSDGARFAPGKSVRGGIPICWPWFGAHAERDDLPAHGFARTIPWRVVESRAMENGATLLRFAPEPGDNVLSMWPYATPVEYQLLIGKSLELQLVTRNESDQPVKLSQALHTYFQIADIHDVTLSGLANCPYLDKVEDFARKQQQGDVCFTSETDRIYLESTQDCVIDDPGLQRKIRIQKRGSNSTVVWNPWQERADEMGDMGEAGYRTMLCVESANAANDAVILEPDSEHTLWVRYDVESR